MHFQTQWLFCLARGRLIQKCPICKCKMLYTGSYVNEASIRRGKSSPWRGEGGGNKWIREQWRNNRFVIKFLRSYSLSEIYFQIFAESAAVVVPRCFRVSKAFQQRRGLENLLGDKIVWRAINSRQILHYEFRGFRFSRTGFTGNNNHLIRASVICGCHLAVRRRAHGEQMAAIAKF